MTEHVLKITPYWFSEIKSGNKTWEIRHNDRDYKAGDWLIIFEHTERGFSIGYSGNSLAVEVIQVYHSKYLPSEDIVIMSIGSPEEIAEEYQDQLAVLLDNQTRRMLKEIDA